MRVEKKRNGATMINDNRFTLCELVIRVLSSLNLSRKLHKKLANNGNNGWCVGWLRKPQDVSIKFFFFCRHFVFLLMCFLTFFFKVWQIGRTTRFWLRSWPCHNRSTSTAWRRTPCIENRLQTAVDKGTKALRSPLALRWRARTRGGGGSIKRHPVHHHRNPVFLSHSLLMSWSLSSISNNDRHCKTLTHTITLLSFATNAKIGLLY